MATVINIMRCTAIGEFGLPAWEDRSPVRPLWVAEELFAWADNTMELHRTRIGGRSLFEHLEHMFCDFRCSPKINHADLKRMLPTRDGVWHMYPAGLRVYGWCPSPNSFVAVTAATAAATKTDPTLNDTKRDHVLRFARRHGLSSTIQTGDFLALFPNKN